jgi:hypothetical protein
VRAALQILIDADDRLGLQPLAEQDRQVYAFNFPEGEQPPAEGQKKRSWWHPW